MLKILITGSSGFIGSALITSLAQRGHWAVYRLVRSKTHSSPYEIVWDPEQGLIDPLALEGFNIVVHLAGENLSGWWTDAKKKQIFDSRVGSTRLLSRTLSQLTNPPQTFICASAVGYYGNRGDEILTESSSQGQGFLADLCGQWEEATRPAVENHIRTIHLRFGMVLSTKGGALKQILPAFRVGLGGRLGSGEQYISWIAIDDVLKIFEFLINHPQLAGPINTVTPYPVQNAEFTKILGEVLHRPTFLSPPTIALKWLFGEMCEEVLLASQRVRPKKLEEAGFKFDYAQLKEALQHLIV